MSFVTAAVIGGVASIGGGLLSASGARSAAAKAADANLRATQMTNDQNQKFFDQSRGAPGADGFGHSVLPTYFGGSEQDLGQQAYANFQKLSGAGDQGFSNLQGYQQQFQPSLNQGINAFNNRFNGQDLAQRMAFSNPYFQSRLNQASIYGQGMRDVAGAQASGINTGLQQALAQINAQRGRQGFLGSSTFDRNRMAASTIGARQQAGMGLATANAGANNLYADAQFQNAGDTRGLQMGNLDFQSRLDTFPAAMSALSGYESGPAQALSNSFSTAMQPLNYFRLSPQAFQQQNMPMQDPQLNGASILGSAIQQGGAAYSNYNLMQQLMSRFGGSGQNPYTMAGAYNPNVFGATSGGYQPMAGATSFSNPYAVPQFNQSYTPQPGY